MSIETPPGTPPGTTPDAAQKPSSDPEKHVVQTVSGEDMTVQTPAESRWYARTRSDYEDQLRFTETTDLRDLDRVLLIELMLFRWGNWLAAGNDYDGFEVDEDKLRMQLRQFNDQLTKVKDSMGLSKRVRDAATAEGNFTVFLQDLKMRAREFGLHRDNQLQKALALMNDISAVIGVYRRSDKEEREKIGFPDEASIIAWIEAEILPAFHSLDEHFRRNTQRMWNGS